MTGEAHEAHEGHVEVPRTARFFTLGDAAAAREVWVVLHGYGQLASFFVRHFAPHTEGRLVVAPEALSRFYLETREGDAGMHGPRVGASWMTREDRDVEMQDYVRYLDRALEAATPNVDWAPASLAVLGFSQGVATAFRWLQARARHGALPSSRLIAWAGEIPPDLDLDSEWLHRTALTFVVGDEDRYATPKVIDRMRATLNAHHVPHELVTFAGDHRMDAETLARLM